MDRTVIAKAKEIWQMLPAGHDLQGISNRYGLIFVRTKFRGETKRFVLEAGGLREVTRSEKNALARKAARELGIKTPKRKKGKKGKKGRKGQATPER